MYTVFIHSALNSYPEYLRGEKLVHITEVVELLIDHGLDAPKFLIAGILHELFEDDLVAIKELITAHGGIEAWGLANCFAANNYSLYCADTAKALGRISKAARDIIMVDCISHLSVQQKYGTKSHVLDREILEVTKHANKYWVEANNELLTTLSSYAVPINSDIE